MQRAYIDYAMSVIVGRALPDVRDGLKPVHRRILYAMYEGGVTPERPHRKSARVVGDVLGRYHPHGDAAVYEALVRMAQTFAMRCPLVDGHGNFGSVDGDGAAAMRYTEVRLSPLALELLRDLEKETVDFTPNYDGSTEEPVVLPAHFPNLLVNGATGIAVGMATNIPPHNLRETIDALILLIDQPEVEIPALAEVIKGPDFPTGGIITGQKGILEAYQTGRGIIKVRGKAEVESEEGKNRILITEIPYQVNKAALVAKIADLIREKHLEGVADLRDESDRNGLRIVLELRREANPRVVLNRLYKHTSLEDTFGVIMLALVEGQPRVLNLKEILNSYLAYQKEIVTRRTRYLLKQAEARVHILEGLLIALENLDAVIATIRASRNPETAREALVKKFSLSGAQAQAILDLRLQRLTALERQKIEEEYQRLGKDIAYWREVLTSEALVLKIIREELLALKEKYGDARRTKILKEVETLTTEDLIAAEEAVVTLTYRGYVKRLPLSTYRFQGRGGRGVSALNTRENDFITHFFVASTHHHLLFFTDQGKVYRLRVYEVPEASRQARGTAIVNLLALGPEEKITAVVAVSQFSPAFSLLLATSKGYIKRTPLKAYDFTRRDGVVALNLTPADRLVGAALVRETDEVILGTRQGMAIRFPAQEVREVGRTARGVKGIALREADEVVGMDVWWGESTRGGKKTAPPYLLVVTSRGYGKRTPLEAYRRQSRGGKGLKALKQTKQNGFLVGLRNVQEKDGVMLITEEGVAIRFHVKEIPVTGRVTQGVHLIRLEPGSRVAAFTVLPRE